MDPPPPPLVLSQIISTCLSTTFSLPQPRSDSSSSTHPKVTDLEGVNYPTDHHPAVGAGQRSSEIDINTSSVPDANHLVTTTQRFLNNFLVHVIGRLWPRSSPTDGRSTFWHWIADHTWQRSRGLPVHHNDNHYRTHQHMQMQQQPQLRLEKTVISLTFQAVIALTIAGKPSNLGDQQLHHLHIFGMVMLFAFASSFSAILLKRAYARTSAPRILEKMGYLFAALGFYLITSIYLPNNFTWICWVASAFSLLAFTLALKAEWDF